MSNTASPSSTGVTPVAPIAPVTGPAAVIAAAQAAQAAATPTSTTPTTEATVAQPTVVASTPVAPVVPAAAPAAQAAAAPSPNYVAFFDQYLGFVKTKTPTNAIKSLNNCIKSMLLAGATNATAFDTVLSLFSTNKLALTPKIMLQSIATLSTPDRAIVEVVTTVFHVILNNQKATAASKLNLVTVRAAVKSDAFVNWCAKKLAA